LRRRRLRHAAEQTCAFGQKILEARCRQGATEQESLQDLAALPAREIQMLLDLDAFRNDLAVEVVRTMASSSGSTPILRTNAWSILIRSAGNRLMQSSDDCPVPKSSIEMPQPSPRKPCSVSSRFGIDLTDALGDFEIKQTRVEAGLLQYRVDDLDQARLSQLQR
jgi:hypothetical protein